MNFNNSAYPNRLNFVDDTIDFGILGGHDGLFNNVNRGPVVSHLNRGSASRINHGGANFNNVSHGLAMHARRNQPNLASTMFFPLNNMNHDLSNPGFVNHGLSNPGFVNHGLTYHVKQEPDLVSSLLMPTNPMNHNLIHHVKQEPDLLTSMLISQNQASSSRFNQNGLVPPPPGFRSRFDQNALVTPPPGFRSRFNQNALVPPPPGFSRQLGLAQRIAEQRRRSIVSPIPSRVQVENVIGFFPVQDRPDLTHLTLTEIVTKNYITTIPTCDMAAVQNDIERVKRALSGECNGWSRATNQANRSHNTSSSNHNTNHPVRRGRVFDPTPLSVVQLPTQDQTPARQNSPAPRDRPGNDLFPPGQNQNQNEDEQPRSQPEPANIFRPIDQEETLQHHHVETNGNVRPEELHEVGDQYVEYFYDYSDEDDEFYDEYDGRTHSLNPEKYGPYVCPRCSMEFETSQKFAAHMLSSHYKFETYAERRRRQRARYKKRRLRYLTNTSHAHHLATQRPVEAVRIEGYRVPKQEDGADDNGGGAADGANSSGGGVADGANANGGGVEDGANANGGGVEDGANAKGGSVGDGTLIDVVVKQEY